jgi:hypothetical protein
LPDILRLTSCIRTVTLGSKGSRNSHSSLDRIQRGSSSAIDPYSVDESAFDINRCDGQ